MADQVDNYVIATSLAGSGEFVAAADVETAAMERLAAATAVAGKEAETTTQRGFLLNQMLYSARRYAFYGTTALLAIGAGAVYAGFKFDSMMQSSQLAFSGLLHSSSLARTELSMLFNLAAHSPFMFQNLTNSVRTLLAFGMNLQQANTVITTSGNALAYFGKSGASLENVAATFGKISQSGRLLMRNMRSLYTEGIPVFPALRTELHLTQDQITKFMQGKLFIPSNIGIQALLDYMNSRFSDGMNRFSHTWTGRWTTFKDYAQMMMGQIVKGPFDAMLSGLGHINDAMETLIKAYQKGGWNGFVNTLDRMTGSGGMLAAVLRELTMWFNAAWTLFRNDLLPALQFGIKIVLGLYLAFYPLAWILEQVFKHGTFLKYLFEFLIAKFIIGRAVTLGFELAIGTMTTMMRLLGGATAAETLAQGMDNMVKEEGRMYTLGYTAALLWNRLVIIANAMALRGATAATILFMFWQQASGYAAEAWAAIMVGVGVVMDIFSGAVDLATASLMALDAAFWISPVGLIILAIVALIAVVVLLIVYFDKVKAAFWAVTNFIISHWKEVLAFILGGPLGWALYHFWDPIVNGLRAALNWVVSLMEGLWATVEWWVRNGLNWIIDKINTAIRLWNDATGWIPFVGSAVHASTIPHLAAGGNIVSAGLVVVGERGPELMQLPRGASVSPIEPLNTASFGRAREGLVARVQAIIPVMLDGDVLAEHNAEILLQEAARA